MITNFQIKPRRCKYHNLPEEFICMFKDCQYRALSCSDCARQNHLNHLFEIRSIEAFMDSFRQKVKFYQSQFQKDKVVINVKEIVKTKLNELDQTMNEILVKVVKMLQKQKELIRQKLLQLEEKYEAIETQYKTNLEARYDCLEYLSAYKNNPQVLEARLICSSEWGIVTLKKALNEIKNLSTNPTRDVNFITDNIIQEGEKILNQDNFISALNHHLKQFTSSTPHNSQNTPHSQNLQNPKNFITPQNNQFNQRNNRANSFIQKSFISGNCSPSTLTGSKTSRVIEQQRPRTFSLSNLGLYRPVSNQNISMAGRQPSIEKIPVKIASETSLDNIKYMKGMRKLKLENVIIKN